MATLYQNIKDYGPDHFTRNIKQMQIPDKNTLSTLPGYVMMTKHPAPGNFADLYARFVDFTRTDRRCIWNPQVSAGGGAPLLDGNKFAGECALFANNLAVLAYAPTPYGLGIAQAQVNVTHYSGLYKKGFVSAHPSLGVLGLRSNFRDRDDMYFWANHKVVSYGGRFYDPSYDKVYNALTDMTLYTIMPNEIEIEGVTYCPAESNVGKGVGVQGQGYWFKEYPNGTYEGPATSIPF